MENFNSKLSDRLLTIANMLKGCGGKCVADVGCDHGYVSIYLVQNGIFKKAIAMDVRKGPLSGAEKSVKELGLSDVIETRLSDGLTKLNENEADCLIVAGMGGKLMMKILEDKDPSLLGIKRCVLQPQSDIPLFRQFLRDKGYVIVNELIIKEEGKYYFPMLVSLEKEKDAPFPLVKKTLQEKYGVSEDRALSVCNRFGECNLLRKDELLTEFLVHGKDVCDSILTKLDKDAHKERYMEATSELKDIEVALSYMTGE